MKKILALALSAVLMLGALAGCGKTTGTVSTDGSTSMEKVMEILGEVFQEKTGSTVNYNPTGSGSGIQAVSEKRCDIGLASRNLKDEEKANGLTGTVVAIDGIAIVVNKENPVSDLTVEQIAKLYTGEITNWSELGGNDAPVVRIGREAASGTRDGFESITKTAEKCLYDQELTSTGDVIATVAGNVNAIGYASLSAVGDTVKVLSVGGVTPSEETVQNGTYAIQRNFVLVTRDDTPLTGAAKAFFDFATSKEADEYIIKAGAVPVVH